MTYLTPTDIRARLGCGIRQAFRLMREAGAWKPSTHSAFLGNAEQSAPWSASKSREEDQATVMDAAVTRHRPQAWALAYAYRDVLSRRAAA